MKRLLLLFLFFISGSVFAQFTIDFETVGQNYVWTIFANGTGDSTDLSLVANPDMSGINTSDSVMKFIVNADATIFAGAFTDSVAPFTITADNAFPTVMVYKDVTSRFNLKFEGFPGAHDTFDSNTVVNEWQELTFDYSADIGQTVTRLTIIPDFPQTSRTAGSTNHFDNIDFGQGFIPVELTAFSASVGNSGVQLNWTTATELNNNGFDIERSADGKSFDKVGFVKGNGTTTDISSYTFLDQNAAGQLYYRLKQIDHDGAFEYSNTIEVDAAVLLKYELAQNFPNPFNPSTSIKYSIPQASLVNIKVYDVLGKEVALLLNEEVEAGIHTINFNGSGLSSGIYYYTITAGNFTNTKKLMLMK